MADTLRKLANNFGTRARERLQAGYGAYLATALAQLPRIVSEGDLKPVDRAMRGVVDLKHPVDGRTVRMDLDAYRSGDDGEGSWAFGLVREIWIRDIYLSHFAWQPPLDCVIDLGANRGVFALQAAAVARRVIAVEPITRYERPLRHNLALNGLDNVEVIHAMIGGEGLVKVPGATTVALADVMDRAGELPVDLIKIDIEGSEFGLDIAQLARARRLAMEVHPAWGDVAALVQALRDAGFELRLYDDALRAATAANADFILALRPDTGARWRDLRGAQP